MKYLLSIVSSEAGKIKKNWRSAIAYQHFEMGVPCSGV
jgi:hypothetical protein